MLAVLPTADDRTLQSLALILHLLFSRLDAFGAAEARSVGRAAALSLQHLLLSLRGKSDALPKLISLFVHRAVLVTVDAAASASAATGKPPKVSECARQLWLLALDPALEKVSRLRNSHLRRGGEPDDDDDAAGGPELGSRRGKEEVCSLLLGALIESISSMTRRLDLGAVRAAESAEHEAGREGAAAEPAAEGEGTALIELSAEADSSPTNRSDLHLFLSLVALCDAILPHVAPELLERWVHVLLLDLVELSGRYPHVSGFYKLIRILIGVAERCEYFRPAEPSPMDLDGAADDDADASAAGAAHRATDRERCYGGLASFLQSTLQRSRRFKDELLAAALDLLLASPLRFVRERLPSMAAVLERALGVGHGYQPLTAAALSAIERWHDAIPTLLAPHLPALLPCLHSCLALSADGAAHAGVARKERDGRRAHSASSRNALKNSAATRLRRSTDELLQLRVVSFLGRVGGGVVSLVQGSKRAPLAEGRWEVSPRVRLAVPLPGEADLTLHLDSVRPPTSPPTLTPTPHPRPHPRPRARTLHGTSHPTLAPRGRCCLASSSSRRPRWSTARRPPRASCSRRRSSCASGTTPRAPPRTGASSTRTSSPRCCDSRPTPTPSPASCSSR